MNCHSSGAVTHTGGAQRRAGGVASVKYSKWKETYIFNKKPWYFSKKDYKRIDKSRKYSSNGNIRDKECGSETTVVTFFVPENTRIKYKDKNDVTIYKNVLDMNTPPNT